MHIFTIGGVIQYINIFVCIWLDKEETCILWLNDKMVLRIDSLISLVLGKIMNVDSMYLTR